MTSTLIALAFVIGLVVVIFGGLKVLRARAAASPQSPLNALFKPRPIPRIEVMEQAYIDGKRKLVLIRRDEVEHLIMTGGPVDVVIETGIASAEAVGRVSEGEARA